MKECHEKAGLKPEDIKTIMDKFKAGQDLDPSLKAKVGCSSKCIMETRGIWKDGGLDAKALEQKLSEFKGLEKVPNVKEAIKECSSTKKGADDCDTAYQISKCFKEKVMKA